MLRKPEIITASIAAFNDQGGLDIGRNKAYLKRIEPFVDGVLAVGTNAEFPSLDFNERKELVSLAIDIFGTDRVIAQVGAPSVRQALRLAQDAVDAGATRFAALTPYYFRASQKGIYSYYQSLREAIDGDLYVYIFPDVANTDLEPETLAKLADIGINGVKLSGVASQRVEIYRRAAPEISLWSGNDADLPHVMDAGGSGVISGVSGVAPKAWAVLRDAYSAGEENAMVNAQQRVQELVKVLGPSIGRLKYALNFLGMPVGECRMVIDEPTEFEKEEIRQVLEHSDIA